MGPRGRDARERGVEPRRPDPDDRRRDAVAPIQMRAFAVSLPMSLLRGREAVMRQFRIGLRHFGITEQQWRVLRALTSVPDIEVTALADMTFLLAPSLTRILKDLDKRGLIRRRVSDEDQRRIIVSISETGLELIERASLPQEAIYAEMTRRYGVEKLRLLQEMLGDLERVLAEPIVLSGRGAAIEDQPLHRRGRPPRER